jgi:hypothetical protein
MSPGNHDAIRRPQSRFAAGVASMPITMVDDPEPSYAPPAPTPTGVDAILEERGNRYGKFVDHAAVTQDLKLVIHTHLRQRGKVLALDQQEALEMICHKIGRIINGDPDYADSWVDIAGYAKLVADRLEGVER